MGIILDILIALLMLVTIGFCYRLSKKITVLNSSKSEMIKFLQEFDGAINRAESNINELKAMGTQVDETLKQQLKKARFLANDLSFLTDKGETIAENLEKKLAEAKAISRQQTQSNYNENSYQNLQHNSQQRIQSNFNPMQVNRRPQMTPQKEADPSQNLMSPSKKLALETILEEIAKRRSINTQTNKTN
jgi:hypothetical protein